MMSKSPQNHQVVEKSGFWLLNPASKVQSVLLALLILFLPTQLGKHFWPSFTLVSGIRIDYLSPTLYFTDILILFLFVHVLWQVKLFGIFKFLRYSPILVLLILFFLENALFALRPWVGFFSWLKLLECVFVASLFARLIYRQSQLVFVTILISIGTFFESLLTILQYVAQSSLNGWLYYLGERTFTGSTPGIANANLDGSLLLRPYATFSHPNVLAGYLLVSMICIACYLVRLRKGFLRYYGIGVLLLSSVALLMTLSRSVILLWFALFCSGLIAYVFKKRSYRRGLIVALLVGTMLGLFFIPFLQHLFVRFSQSSLSEQAVTQRLALLTDSWQMIQKYPLTGVGLNNFIPALSPLTKPLSLSLYLQPVHNIYLLVLAECGVIGLGIFLWFFIKTYRRLWQMIKNSLWKKDYAVACLLLTCLLFIGLFDHYLLTSQQGQLLFAVVIGLCWMSVVRK